MVARQVFVGQKLLAEHRTNKLRVLVDNSSKQQTPSLLTFERVLRVSRHDGVLLMGGSGAIAIFAALEGIGWAAVLGCLAAGAGVMELSGRNFLRQGAARAAVRLLVGSQLFLLALIWAYVAWRLLSGVDPRMIELVLSNMPQELRAEYALRGFGPDELRSLTTLLFNAAYIVLAFVSLCYQGGLAFYYLRRRRILEVFCAGFPRNSGLASG